MKPQNPAPFSSDDFRKAIKEMNRLVRAIETDHHILLIRKRKTLNMKAK